MVMSNILTRSMINSPNYFLIKVFICDTKELNLGYVYISLQGRDIRFVLASMI